MKVSTGSARAATRLPFHGFAHGVHEKCKSPGQTCTDTCTHVHAPKRTFFPVVKQGKRACRLERSP